jgi:hypothetical protein
MSKRAAWVLVFSASMLAYAIIVAFGTSVWTLFAMAPPLIGAFASFAYLYAKGSGLPEQNDARGTNR